MERRLVHLVDDDEAVRCSTSFMLRTSGFDVETYASGVAFLAAADHVEPGCVLLDVRMPEIDGLSVQRQLNARGVTLPVVVLTGHGDVSTAVEAMKAGAVDFLEKPLEHAPLLRAIDTAFARMARPDAIDAAGEDARVRIDGLTPREQDVLRGLARGRPNKTIAHDLGISPRTVEVHRANLMARLGVRSFAEALQIAFAAGLEKAADRRAT